MKPLFYTVHPLIVALLAGIAIQFSDAQEEQPTPAPAEPSADEIEAQVQQLFKELGDESFKVREAATLKLWQIGDRAEPFVREAASGGDIELRTRSAKLLALFKYGIYPDTPPATVKLINEFRHGDNGDKVNAIRQLYEEGELVTVTKLVRSVESTVLRQQLVSSVVDQSDAKLAELFANGKYDDVQTLLTLAAISDEGFRDLSAFHFHRGTLDREIAHLIQTRKATALTPIQHEQLAWHYRFKGELEKALTAATESKNKNLITSISIAQGDLQALIASSFNPADRTIEAFGYTAASQRLKGDVKGFEETIATILEYAADNPEEEDACMKALLINGRIQDAIAVASEGADERIDLLTEQGEHKKALAELGLESTKPPFDQWMKKLSETYAAAEDTNDRLRTVGDASVIIQLLINKGEKDAARQVIEHLGSLTVDADIRLTRRLVRIANGLGMHELGLSYAIKALEREAKEAKARADLPAPEREAERIQNLVALHDTEDALVYDAYYGDSQSALFWWGKLRKTNENEDPTSRLKLLEILLGYEQKGEPAAIELLKKFVPEELAEENVELPTVLAYLSDLYLRHDDRPTATALLEKSLALDREDAAYANHRYATMLAQDGEWEKALPYFKEATIPRPHLDPEDHRSRTNTIYSIHYGIALERTGNQKEAEKVISQAKLAALGRPRQHHNISQAFATFNEFERARQASQLVVDTATLDDPNTHVEAQILSDYIAYLSPQRAAKLKEHYLIGCLKGNVQLNNLSAISSTRGSIGSLQTRVALKAGDVEKALEIITPLVDQQPSNSSLIEDIYPLLVLAGEKEKADQLYEKLNEYGEEALAIFPNSPQDLNSNAWLKARCGKDLDTALTRSEKSNELRKNSEAYLDTLAEIHFQRGDREKAIETSKKAVKLAPGEYLLYHQLQRFKNAEPLSKLLTKREE